jgi:hypothetical protein
MGVLLVQRRWSLLNTNDEQWQASLAKELRAAGYTLPE